MIKRETINGRQATVCYMLDDFTPVDTPAEATLVKVVFDDGNVLFLVPADPVQKEDITDDDSVPNSGKKKRKKPQIAAGPTASYDDIAPDSSETPVDTEHDLNLTNDDNAPLDKM